MSASAETPPVVGRAAQQEPERYRSLRGRMGGWFPFFTVLNRKQQDHQIRRHGGRLL